MYKRQLYGRLQRDRTGLRADGLREDLDGGQRLHGEDEKHDRATGQEQCHSHDITCTQRNEVAVVEAVVAVVVVGLLSL